MCSQFEVDNTMDHVQVRFDLSEPPEFSPNPQVRPTNRVPVITSAGRAEMLRWGLETDWDNKPLINARSETLTEKKTFSPLLESRCLIPATAYFEWRKDAKAKIKTRIWLKEHDVFAFAGLRKEDRFTVITCAPSPSISHIHGRMPVILNRGSEEAWINENNTYAQVKEVLVPFASEQLLFEDITPPRAQGDLFG